MQILFVLTSFLAAALLFLVQPMVGRMVLPAFGGSPQVWTTSMLFFQVALLAGYAYAHGATSRIPARQQPWVHVGVGLLPLLLLPIAIDVAPSGAGGGAPIRELLGALALGAGAPFLVVATSGPLLQRWFSWTDHPSAHDPYFLYAAGNLGSAVGLLAYPFALEPTLSVAAQSRLWTVGYAVVLALLAACAALVARWRRASEAPAPTEETAERLAGRRVLRWVACAFVPSSLMLGATALISTDIAAVPLIWVVPLGLYLLTYTAAFSRLGPTLLRAAVPLAIPAAVAALVIDSGMFGPIVALLVQLVLVVVSGLAGHGMLAADRPPAALLTRFYLMIGIGGALGGLFNGVVAPLAFDGLFEHAIAAAALVALVVSWQPGPARARGRPVETAVALALAAIPILLVLPRLLGVRPRSAASAWVVLAVLLAPLLTRWARRGPLVAAVLIAGLAAPVREIARAEFTTRTFFGRYQVTMRDGVARLTNGTTAHGTQDQRTPEGRLRPTAYYDPLGPLGWVMSDVRGDVGAIGLGAGAIAAYGQPGQTIVFHEIDPAVVDIARSRFSYLGDSRAHIEIVTGDGRLTVDRVPGRYDVLIVDGFTSDAIPVHLITAEAFRTYFDALREDGLIAVHITNRFVGLEPVMRGIGEQLGVDVVGAAGMSIDDITSVWVVMSRSAERLDRLRANGWIDLAGPSVRWTDQRSSLFEVLVPPES
jgi:hypothetical protein